MCAEWHCVALLSTRNLIIPPRARGRLGARAPRGPMDRITPACAGKTAAAFHFHEDPTDHPRMRGEDTAVPNSFAGFTGSPPHARGRPCQWMIDGTEDGAHPRMRGEDLSPTTFPIDSWGSPPHARGRPAVKGGRAGRRGLTPACAGKTNVGELSWQARWAHPRMRGEDRREMARRALAEGSPPHARGRRGGSIRSCSSEGLTPACAGKTSSLAADSHERLGSPPHAWGRRPRRPGSSAWGRLTPACAGKTYSCSAGPAGVWGSPPHARGRRHVEEPAEVYRGLTPACAGKTFLAWKNTMSPGAHPRMRGEDVLEGIQQIILGGSPPHARGRRKVSLRPRRSDRLTPACAGKTDTITAI